MRWLTASFWALVAVERMTTTTSITNSRRLPPFLKRPFNF
jgi:hypothetical protein